MFKHPVKKYLAGFAFLLSLSSTAWSYDPNIPPTVNGLHLGDSYSQVIGQIGNAEVLPMEPGVFTMFYYNGGLSLVLVEQAGISRIEQIDVSIPRAGNIYGVQIGQAKTSVEQLVGPLSYSETENSNDAFLLGRGWRIHFVFDDQDILQRFVLFTSR